jgi:hypothetical protein
MMNKTEPQFYFVFKMFICAMTGDDINTVAHLLKNYLAKMPGKYNVVCKIVVLFYFFVVVFNFLFVWDFFFFFFFVVVVCF